MALRLVVSQGATIHGELRSRTIVASGFPGYLCRKSIGPFRNMQCFGAGFPRVLCGFPVASFTAKVESSAGIPTLFAPRSADHRDDRQDSYSQRSRFGNCAEEPKHLPTVQIVRCGPSAFLCGVRSLHGSDSNPVMERHRSDRAFPLEWLAIRAGQGCGFEGGLGSTEFPVESAISVRHNAEMKSKKERSDRSSRSERFFGVMPCNCGLWIRSQRNLSHRSGFG